MAHSWPLFLAFGYYKWNVWVEFVSNVVLMFSTLGKPSQLPIAYYSLPIASIARE